MPVLERQAIGSSSSNVNRMDALDLTCCVIWCFHSLFEPGKCDERRGTTWDSAKFAFLHQSLYWEVAHSSQVIDKSVDS